jgi:hypothetical protein
MGSSSGDSSLGLADVAGRGLAVVSASLFVLSVVYDMSYLARLGLRFGEVPTSLADHVRSAILWTPGFAFAIVGATLFMLIRDRVRSHVGGASTSVATKLSLIGKTLDVAVVSVLLGLAVMYGLFYAWAGGVFFFAALGWYIAALWVTWNRFSRPQALLFRFIPFLACLVGFGGYSDADRLIRGNLPRWEITIRVNSNDVEVKQLVGLRRFEAAAVVIGTAHDVSVIPAASLEHARLLVSAYRSPERNACRWFGIGCVD